MLICKCSILYSIMSFPVPEYSIYISINKWGACMKPETYFVRITKINTCNVEECNLIST